MPLLGASTKGKPRDLVRTLANPLSRNSSPSHEAVRSRVPHSSNNEGDPFDARDESQERRGRAAALKMPVPNTLHRHSTNNHGRVDLEQETGGADAVDENENVTVVPQQSQRAQHPPRSAFDDTTSLGDLSDDFSAVQEDQRTDSYNRGYYTQPARAASSQDKQYQQYSTDFPHDTHHHGQPIESLDLPDDWEAQVADERQRRGWDEDPYGRPLMQDDVYNTAYHEEEDAVEATPSRIPSTSLATRNPPTSRKVVFKSPPARTLPSQKAVKPALRFTRPASPLAYTHTSNLVNQSAYEDQGDDQQAVTQVLRRIELHGQDRPLAINPKLATKITTIDDTPYPSSSDEEQPPPTSTLPNPAPAHGKRQHSELDYDLDQLKSMTYDHLQAVPFSTDPRSTEHLSTVDTPAHQPTLVQQLDNLTKLPDDDQRSLFRAQTDAEWEQTGTWFVEKFAADLRRLMEARLERRKVALRFELEVRKRQKLVEVHSEAVELELKGLKKGGGELIAKSQTPR